MLGITHCYCFTFGKYMITTAMMKIRQYNPAKTRSMYVCLSVGTDENVLSYKALLSIKTSSSPNVSRHRLGRRWNDYLCIRRDRVQLPVHSQCLASLHVVLHRLSTARQKTATQRYDGCDLSVSRA